MGVEAVLMNKLFITIVLYEQYWENLLAAPVLEKVLSQDNFGLLIYDNSKTTQSHVFFSQKNVVYYHNPQNPGLAQAYNYGLQLAADFNLLLLLDQDTDLTEEYLKKLQAFPLDDNVGAIVPKMIAGKKQISPVLAKNYINRHLEYPPDGRNSSRVMAINSGAAVNILLLKKMGGFDEHFALDFLDHWLFFMIFKEGKDVWVIDERLPHDLSVLHYETMTTERYRSILASESYFYQNFDRKNQSNHQKQLLKRTLKQFIKVRNRAIWKLTWQEYQHFRKDRE